MTSPQRVFGEIRSISEFRAYQGLTGEYRGILGQHLHRQFNGKDRASHALISYAVADGELAAVRSDDTSGDVEAETAAGNVGFLIEPGKGVENTRHLLLRDACSMVEHADIDMLIFLP